LVRKQYLQLRRHTHRDHVAPRTPKRQRYSCTHNTLHEGWLQHKIDDVHALPE
jgi:hypothetical protein